MGSDIVGEFRVGATATRSIVPNIPMFPEKSFRYEERILIYRVTIIAISKSVCGQTSGGARTLQKCYVTFFG